MAPVTRSYEDDELLLLLSSSFTDVARKTAPLVWYPMTDPSGTTITSFGSLGSGNGTLTPGVGGLAQNGKLGAIHAVDFDGADTVITGPTSTSINNANQFTVAALLRADSAGEGSAGYIWADNGGNRILAINLATMRLSMSVWASSAYASVDAAAPSGLAIGTWYMIFGTYDDLGDRKPSIWTGLNGSVAEQTYSAETAAAAVLSNASGALKVGNNGAGSRTWDGLYDEFLFWNRVLSIDEMVSLVKAAKV